MLAFAAFFGLGVWKIGVPAYHELSGSFAVEEFRTKGVPGTFQYYFFRFFGQVDDMARVDHNNDTLQKKVADLEKKATVLETKQVEREIAAVNEKVEETLADQAGSELATAKKTIVYEMPRNLSYAQLYALAIGYFKQGDHEKCAILMNHLLSLKEEPKYRIPENYVLNGISWFHLKNYHLALQNVMEAKKESHPADDSHRHALLWEAMIRKRLNRPHLSQETLLKVLELYPHSDEARYVNEGVKPVHEEKRAPASEHGEKHGDAHPAESHPEDAHKKESHQEEAHPHE